METPSKEVLMEQVKEIMKTGDLSHLTFKKIYSELETMFHCDLSDIKPFLRDIVKDEAKTHVIVDNQEDIEPQNKKMKQEHIEREEKEAEKKRRKKRRR